MKVHVCSKQLHGLRNHLESSRILARVLAILSLLFGGLDIFFFPFLTHWYLVLANLALHLAGKYPLPWHCDSK